MPELDSGGSPVIGVILMVAITVILAAVIAAFVLGFGADQDSAPQATWSESEDGDQDSTVTFTHQGGDSVDPDRLSPTGAGSADATVGVGDAGGATTLTAGSSITFDTAVVNAGTTVNLVWNQEVVDETSIL